VGKTPFPAARIWETTAGNFSFKRYLPFYYSNTPADFWVLFFGKEAFGSFSAAGSNLSVTGGRSV
jgi:hypothetical protein